MKKTYPITSVIAVGLVQVATVGEFISAAKANRENVFSTAHFVKQTLLSDPEKKVIPTSDPQLVIDYVNKLDPVVVNTVSDDYHQRLKDVYEKENVTYKEISMVVSALAFFNNPKMPNSNYKEMIANSNFIGKLKQRDKFFVKLLKEMSKHEYWIYKFITRDGSLGYFFKNDKLGVTQGECFLFKGTPISHEEDRYDKVPVTKFNRIAHVENYGSKTGE